MVIAQHISRIRRFLEQRGPWRAAREAGLYPGTLRHFRKDEWNPTRETLEAVEKIIPPDFDGENGKAA